MRWALVSTALWLAAGAIAAAAVPARQAAAQRVEVRAAGVAATLDAATGLVSLRDLRRGRELLPPGGSPRLFALELTEQAAPAGQRITLTNLDQAERSLRREAAGACATYRNLAGRGVDVTVRVAPDTSGALLRWRLEATFPEGLRLEAVRFPIVLLAPRIGPGEAWVTGATKGGVHTAPSAWPPGRSVVVGQPGNMAAAFGCYYDAGGGLYTAAQDGLGTPKALAAGRTPEGVEVQWYRACYAERRWKLDYDVVTGPFGGTGGRPADWRDAADLYKRWAVTQPWCARTLARRADLPAWLKQGPAMVRFGRDWLARPARIDRWISAYWAPGFRGVPLITAYWGWEKVETWVTPDYFPVFASDDQFKALVARSRTLGAHAFLWPSGYHYTLTYGKQADGTFRWDDRGRFEAVARAHAVVGRNGKVLIGDRSWLQGGQTATMCPGDPWTIAWFDATAKGCVARGAEVVQVDQVVGGSFPACYSTTHGHPPGPGPWMTEVFHKQLESMRRAMGPGKVACFEEPNEVFLQHVGLQDYRDWEVVGQPGVQPASVFNYLYHEYVPTFQSNPRAGDLRQMAWCLVNGQMPHLVPTSQFGAGPLLANGGFEEGDTGVADGWDRVSGWQGQVWTGSGTRDAAESHSGRASLRLRNTEPGQTVQVSQNVPTGGSFRTGKTYRLSVWVKSGGTAPGNALMLGTFAPGLRSTWSGRIPIPAQPGGWTRGEVTFSVPAGSEFLRIMLHLTGPGTVWVDDMALEEVRPDGTTAPVMRPARSESDALMRAWVSLYHGAGRPYLLFGQMLHPPTLATETVEADGLRLPAILHNAYEAPDGSRAVVLVNATDAPRMGVLTWGGKRVELSMRPLEVRLVKANR